jgi:site-specific DNA-methyltransferase (cytosine-N4-specific)
MEEIYSTNLGNYFLGDINNVILNDELKQFEGKIDLILTSPPFPLVRPKKYGNLDGSEYLEWIGGISRYLKKLLSPNGSIVLEIGNAWIKGVPEMSVLPLKSLMYFLEEGDYKLCQQFIWNNIAKLPSPAQWVNVKRIRVKDAFTNIWWMANDYYPEADNRKILKEYSSSMKKLLKDKKYNAGSRPSEHVIGIKSFFSDNSGAIPSNVLSLANTSSEEEYIKYCQSINVAPHPARMPSELVEFFIKFLTKENGLILDPFGGSNTTGLVAEKNNRRWISIDREEKYILGSEGRFSSTKQPITSNV